MSNKREALQSLVAGIRQDILDYRELKKLLQQQRQLMLRHDNQGLSSITSSRISWSPSYSTIRCSAPHIWHK